METKQGSNKYQLVILISGFILMAVPFSLTNAIQPLFISPVTKAFGFSLSSFSLLFTISAIVMAFASPIIGNAINRVNIKIIMTFGAILVGLGNIAYSFATSIYLFYIIGTIVSVGIGCLTILPISTMISNWFDPGKKGSVMGVVFAGAGTGTFFWMQIISRIIENYGFRRAYIIIGIIVLVVSLPISLFIVKKSPDGDIKKSKDNTDKKQAKDKLSFGEMSKAPAFWTFSIGLLLMGITVAGIQLHIQSYLSSLDYALTFNANIGSVLAISALLGSVLGGLVFDKFNIKTVMVVVGVLSLVSIGALIFAQNSIFAYVFAVVFGLSLVMPSLWPSYGVSRLFDNRHYSVILGVVNMFFTIGGAIGPFLSGLMADSIGGYKLAWYIYFVLTAIYYILFISAVRHASPNKVSPK